MTQLRFFRFIDAYLELADDTELELANGDFLELAETGLSEGVEAVSSTLFDLVYRTFRELGLLVEGRATNGSSTTLIDTNDRNEANDYWNGGTLFIVKDAEGANAPPQGEYTVIEDFIANTHSLVFRDALSASVAAGDRYALVDGKRVKLERVMQAINTALYDLGAVPLPDMSLVTESEKMEYELPTAASLDLRRVYLQTDKDDDDSRRFTPIHNYKLLRSEIGENDILDLGFQPDPGYKILLIYTAIHPELHSPADTLADSVPVERVIYPAALEVARWYRDTYRIASWAAKVADLERKTDTAKRQRVIVGLPRHSRLMVPSGNRFRLEYPGDRRPR